MNHSTLANCAFAVGWAVASVYELTEPSRAFAYGCPASSGFAVFRSKLNVPLKLLERAAGRVVYS